MPEKSPSPGASELNFTAARIAAALGLSKRAVLSALRGIKAASQVATAGGMADAWPWRVIPARYQSMLAKQAVSLGYPDAVCMLTDAPEKFERWNPPIPVSELAQHCVDQAVKLRDALVGSLRRMDNLDLSPGEFDRLGIEDYRRVFGYPISARHFQNLLNRAVERDRGREDWSRLEIYFAKRLARKNPSPARSTERSDAQFSTLTDILDTFRTPASPRKEEKAYLLFRAFELLDVAMREHVESHRYKGELLDFLAQRAPFLAPNKDALRRDFNRKFKRWCDNGRGPEALLDGRAAANARRKAPPLSEKLFLRMTGEAEVHNRQDIAPAYRMLRKDPEFSDELSRFTSRPSRKSYVPLSIRRAIQPAARMIDDIHHGEKTAKVNGPYIRPKHDTFAQDYFQADDLTPEIYAWSQDDRGEVRLIRMQTLPWMDFASTAILSVVVVEEKYYNAASILMGITKTCLDYGMPHVGLALEGGLWKTSRLLKGNRRHTIFDGDPDTGIPSWHEAELGLRRYFKFRHATKPQGKPIESRFRLIQRKLVGELGYVGPCEPKEPYERVQKLIKAVQAGRADPREHFLSADEYLNRFRLAVEQYNAEPMQDSRHIGNRSPIEAWRDFKRPGDPPSPLPRDCEWLLAAHKWPTTVKGNGVWVPFDYEANGTKGVWFNSEETADREGRSVVAAFNPMTPDHIFILDPDSTTPVLIPREIQPSDSASDGNDEDIETLRDASRRMAAMRRRAKILYMRVLNVLPEKPRPVALDPATAAMTQAVKEQEDAHYAKSRARDRVAAQCNQFARDIGLPPAAVCRDRFDPDHARELQDFLRHPENCDSES